MSGSNGEVGRGIVGALIVLAIAIWLTGCSTIKSAGIGDGRVSDVEKAALNAARPGAGDLLAGILGGNDDGGYVATVTITDATGHVLVPPYTIDETKRRTRTVGELTGESKGGGWAAILEQVTAIQSNINAGTGTTAEAIDILNP